MAPSDEHPHARLLQLHHQGRLDRHGLLLQLKRRQDARQLRLRHRILEEKPTIQSNTKALSYWQGIDRITSPPHANYTYSVLAGVYAGIDMIMVDPKTEVVFSENPDSGYVKQNVRGGGGGVGEVPHAETNGDSLNMTLPEPGQGIISNVCGSVRCVVVLVTERPVVIEPYLGQIDALVAAWLPGTEGQGVADVLFGNFGFMGGRAGCPALGLGPWTSCP
ncbi:hypothetical protein SASPL_124853 [Salvia splendens]|uniref:Glycoside hydrolase family 3 C-terminal domain-containing protein n=1 Tax=Salvia splendens TaxID=180675 RepID=A0A8X8ZPI2_SALSN|nr:hypothetical protein SASPL_124853 [Salvia splendens]